MTFEVLKKVIGTTNKNLKVVFFTLDMESHLGTDRKVKGPNLYVFVNIIC